MHRFSLKPNDENKAEYEKIKGNFLEAIREKISILRKTLQYCETGCKEECNTHYHGLYGGGGSGGNGNGNSGSSMFTTFMKKFRRNDDGKTDDGKTDNESDDSKTDDESNDKSNNKSDDESDDESGNNTHVSKFQDLYKKIKRTPEEKRNANKEKFCKDFFSPDHFLNSRGRYGFPLEICSLPNQISSKGTQSICKMAIALESDIKVLLKMYKSDVVHDEVTKLKSEFLKLSKTPTTMGGSKTKRRLKKR